MKTPEETLNDAISEVRRQIERVVRLEQQRDRLTGLANDLALGEGIEDLIAGEDPFWIAFVEVDQFKRVNDEFGYDNADGLLRRVAKHLEYAVDFFPAKMVPYRPHGDEFFLLGLLADGDPGTDIHDGLEQIRTNIMRLSTPVAGKARAMKCTVSIGWALSTDAAGDNLTARHLKVMVEQAVDHAKRSGRNKVVRYSDGMSKSEVWTVRENCSSCKASFTVDIPAERTDVGNLACPNCHSQYARPSRPEGMCTGTAKPNAQA